MVECTWLVPSAVDVIWFWEVRGFVFTNVGLHSNSKHNRLPKHCATTISKQQQATTAVHIALVKSPGLVLLTQQQATTAVHIALVKSPGLVLLPQQTATTVTTTCHFGNPIVQQQTTTFTHTQIFRLNLCKEDHFHLSLQVLVLLLPTMQTSNLAAVSGMKKAQVLEELAEMSVTGRDSWSVIELRALLKDLRMEKDGVQMDPMKGMASKKLSEVYERCLSIGLPVDASYRKAELLILLRSHYEDKSGSQTLMAIGKHKGSTFEQILQADPQYVEWARAELSDNSHIMLKAMVFWSYRMDGVMPPPPTANKPTTKEPMPKSMPKNSRQPRKTSAASSGTSSKGEAPSTSSFEIMTDPGEAENDKKTQALEAAEKDKKIQELEEELTRLQGRNTTRRTAGTTGMMTAAP
jgi:hypothetical protein